MRYCFARDIKRVCAARPTQTTRVFISMRCEASNMERRRAARRERLYLCIAIAAVITSILYWTAFGINAYNTYHEYDDLGFTTMSMYYHIHYPQALGGLEYLVFWNHIAPDQLLILPIFYLYQSSLTLLFVQALGLSLTGLLIFFVVRDLVKSGAWALTFCLVYLLNPGMHGMLVFDYHFEFLIVPFYVLVFYFYMKLRVRWFFASLLLLLGTIDTAPFLAIFLGIGLLVYDFSYTRERKARRLRLTLATCMVAFSIAVIVSEAAIASALTQSYGSAYADLPTQFRVYDFGTGVASSLIGKVTGSNGQAWSAPSFNVYIVYGIAIALFSFGAAIFFDPLITLIFAAPWLANVLVLGNLNFAVVWDQYYSYVLGGAVVGAVLGLLMLKERRGLFARMAYGFLGRSYEVTMGSFLGMTMVVATLMLTAMYPVMVYSKNINNLTQDFLFQVGPQQRALDAQIGSMLALVPANASLLTMPFVIPHVADRKYLDNFPFMDSFFTPRFVLVDMSENVSLNAQLNEPYLTAFLRNNSFYHVYARNGTAYILERGVQTGSG